MLGLHRRGLLASAAGAPASPLAFDDLTVYQELLGARPYSFTHDMGAGTNFLTLRVGGEAGDGTTPGTLTAKINPLSTNIDMTLLRLQDQTAGTAPGNWVGAMWAGGLEALAGTTIDIQVTSNVIANTGIAIASSYANAQNAAPTPEDGTNGVSTDTLTVTLFGVTAGSIVEAMFNNNINAAPGGPTIWVGATLQGDFDGDASGNLLSWAQNLAPTTNQSVQATGYRVSRTSLLAYAVR